jgi:hypothetical protein
MFARTAFFALADGLRAVASGRPGKAGAGARDALESLGFLGLAMVWRDEASGVEVLSPVVTNLGQRWLAELAKVSP